MQECCQNGSCGCAPLPILEVFNKVFQTNISVWQLFEALWHYYWDKFWINIPHSSYTTNTWCLLLCEWTAAGFQLFYCLLCSKLEVSWYNKTKFNIAIFWLKWGVRFPSLWHWIMEHANVYWIWLRSSASYIITEYNAWLHSNKFCAVFFQVKWNFPT